MKTFLPKFEDAAAVFSVGISAITAIASWWNARKESNDISTRKQLTLLNCDDERLKKVLVPDETKGAPHVFIAVLTYGLAIAEAIDCFGLKDESMYTGALRCLAFLAVALESELEYRPANRKGNPRLRAVSLATAAIAAGYGRVAPLVTMRSGSDPSLSARSLTLACWCVVVAAGRVALACIGPAPLVATELPLFPMLTASVLSKLLYLHWFAIVRGIVKLDDDGGSMESLAIDDLPMLLPSLRAAATVAASDKLAKIHANTVTSASPLRRRAARCRTVRLVRLVQHELLVQLAWCT